MSNGSFVISVSCASTYVLGSLIKKYFVEFLKVEFLKVEFFEVEFLKVEFFEVKFLKVEY